MYVYMTSPSDIYGAKQQDGSASKGRDLTWWKERRNSYKLLSDLYTKCTPTSSLQKIKIN